MRLVIPLLALAIALTACDPDASSPMAPDADTGPAPECPDGVDSDGDGVCDRERADWSREATVPVGTDRGDVFGLGDARNAVVTRGLGHAQLWPVEVSGTLLPWEPMRRLYANDTEDDALRAVQGTSRQRLGFGTLDEMYAWLGLARADEDGEAWPGVAWPEGTQPGDHLGAGVVDTQWGEALTFSCATCHTAEFFGHTVVGLTNRRAQANEYFYSASTFFPDLPPRVFQNMTGADAVEMEMFVRTQERFGAVGLVLPQARGLDTSLAQVGLSLARRALDEHATRDPEVEAAPRPNALEAFVADSKPAVWWTLRYKTRWLSDGSIVSGNPIFTNFLWNELGRGTDLDELEVWLDANRQIVDELTVAAFATQAPRWSEIFPDRPIDVGAAERGQAHFEEACASCHGTYAKDWSGDDPTRTTRVTYFEQTPVYDVGTSPQRREGMSHFADRLNELAISKAMGTVVEVQPGYVPPPLDGVFARYPYLHNQSVPTLCDLLTPAPERTALFYMGPDEDPATDYDFDCVGLPTGEAVPAAWTEEPRDAFDTTRPGMSNQGHDAWLVDADGSPRFTEDERRELIEFLKTL